MNEGFIKLRRGLLDWDYIDEPNVLSLFVICILKANHKPQKWRGIDIGIGEFVSSYEKLSIESGLTVQQVRTAVNKLKKTGDLTSKATNKYTLFKVVKYEKQEENKEVVTNKQQTNNKQITNKQQTNNKQITTNKNEKNYKNEYNDNNDKNIIKKINKKEEPEIIEKYFDNITVNELFLEYLETRSKKSNTERSVNMLINKTNGFTDEEIIEALETSIAGNYKSIFPKKKQEQNKSKNILHDISYEDIDNMEF